MMQFLTSLSPAFLLGLIGWAATYLLINDSPVLSFWQRRALTVFTWLLWMVPAFDVTVYQGLMSAQAALFACSAMTLFLTLLTTANAILVRARK